MLTEEEFDRAFYTKWDIAKQALRAADPLWMCRVGEDLAPEGEYDFEAGIISDFATSARDADELARIICFVFQRTTEQDFTPDDFIDVAQELAETWPEDGMEDVDEETSLLEIDEFLSGYDDLYDEWNRDAGTITAPDGREIRMHYTLHAIAVTVPKTLGES